MVVYMCVIIDDFERRVISALTLCCERAIDHQFVVTLVSIINSLLCLFTSGGSILGNHIVILSHARIYLTIHAARLVARDQ